MMAVQVCLCIMCGLPASGKSSFCERLYQDLVNDYLVIHINFDKILLSQNTDKIQLHDSLLMESQDKIENTVLKSSRRQVLHLVEIIIQHLRKHGTFLSFESLDGRDQINKDIQENFLSSCKRNFSNATKNLCDVILLIDDNFYFSSMRYDFYKMARQCETGFCEILMDCSTERALERNRMREGRELVSDDVILKMAEKLEPPNPEKNQWEKYSMRVSTDEKTNVVFPMIEEALANPVQPIPQVDEKEQALSQAVCSKSLIHQTDLVLRQCVAKAMANGKKASRDVRLLSQQAMAAKEEILNNLKGEHLNIPLDVTSTSIQNASKDEDCDLFRYIYSLFNEKLKEKA